MKFINKQFAEFKSIFVSENLLKENEEHANIVTSSTMLNVFWITVITWALVYFNVFKVGIKMMNNIMIYSFILLVIPSMICNLKKGKGKWIKHLLFISFTLMLAIADLILKYNVTLIMVLPIILAARYYNKKFTIGVAILTTLIFALSANFSIKIGQQDLNSYNLIIPSGTTITVDTTLRDAITKLNIDETQRIKNIFIHFFIPKILVFNIIAFACAQISQSGKNMIKKQQEITKTSERIETELNLANAIQQHMLPSIFPPFPQHKEIDIYASMIPAKEVGGDFYDMFLIDEDHLAISIADVSGKGVPASLFMMISKILIKNVSKIESDVDKIFYRVNNMLCDGNETGFFVTCWFGILNLKTGLIDFVNAGHNPPLVYSKKTKKFEYLKTKANLVLAGLDNSIYTKQQIQIEQGDRIFLYTDGVVESTNINNIQYGEERLKEYLNNHLELNAKEIIEGVKKDIDEFVGEKEQFDDITMLEFIYKKEKNNKLKKEFTAKIEELTKVQEFVENTIKEHCDKKTINQINLAIEEIFINIAKYAYEDIGKCSLSIELNKDKINFIFEDSGIEFNPLNKNNPDISLKADERNIGGLGIYLAKELMDEVSYKYENKKNILILTKFKRS